MSLRGGKKGRNVSIDSLRLLCMVMLATYHMFNFYGADYVSIQTFGTKALIVENCFWAGGRMICNIFVFISAWFLCEKVFSTERMIKVWLTVLFYSVPLGIFEYITEGDLWFLVKHLFPITSGQVWYATAYIGLLILMPVLNLLLRVENRKLLDFSMLAIFVFNSILPTFFPKIPLRLGTLGWFCFIYLMVAILKLDGKQIAFRWAMMLFLIGWSSALLLYNCYDYLYKYPVVQEIIGRLGIYRGMYFADLATLPCLFSAFGLFFMFVYVEENKHRLFSTRRVWGGYEALLHSVSIASLDIYIINSIEGSGKKLAWIEVMQHMGLNPVSSESVFNLYVLIFFEIVVGTLIGNFRERLYKGIARALPVSRWCKKLDSKICSNNYERLLGK